MLYILTANSRRCRGTFFLSEFSYINLISICIVSAPTGLSQHLHASLPTKPSYRTCNCCVILNETKPRPGSHHPEKLTSKFDMCVALLWHVNAILFILFSSLQVETAAQAEHASNVRSLPPTSPPSGPRCIKNWECDLPSTGRRPRNQTGS